MRDAIAKVCAERGWTLGANAITVQLPSGRHQVVQFEEYESSGEQLMRLYSILGEASAFDERQLRAALRLNWTLPFGAIGLGAIGDEPEQLLLCETGIIDHINHRRLGLAIQAIAATADRYEDTVFGTDEH